MMLFVIGLLCGWALMGAAVLVLAALMLSSRMSREDENARTRPPPPWAKVRGRWAKPGK